MTLFLQYPHLILLRRDFSRNPEIWKLNCVWQYTHRYSSKSRWIGPHFLYWERSTFIAVDKNCIRYKHNSPAFHQEVNKPHTSSPCHISPSVKTQSLHERPSPCQPTVSWAQARFDWDECLQVQNVPKNTCLGNHGVISCLLISHSEIKM